MLVTGPHIEGEMQVGGGAGWVTDRVRTATASARLALDSTRADWGRMPAVGPHPREAALAAAREAVIHLNEALSVVAPEDAIMDTRHALEELTATIAELEQLPNRPVVPGELPHARFERAIELLTTAEHKLTGRPWGFDAVATLPMRRTGGYVDPPWGLDGGPGAPGVEDPVVEPPPVVTLPALPFMPGDPHRIRPIDPDPGDVPRIMHAPDPDDVPRIMGGAHGGNPGIVPPWLQKGGAGRAEGTGNGNPGIVPPWLQVVTPPFAPVAPIDPETPHIMGGDPDPDNPPR